MLWIFLRSSQSNKNKAEPLLRYSKRRGVCKTFRILPYSGQNARHAAQFPHPMSYIKILRYFSNLHSHPLLKTMRY